MADIFREIDEDVRRDKALEFWKNHGSKLIAVAFVAVAATGGWRAYQSYEAQRAEAAGARFETAIEKSRAGDTDEAEQEFAAIAKDSTAGYQRLARFRQAAEQAKQSPADGAKTYDALAADTSVAPILRDLARLRAAMLLADTASLDELRTRLQPLLAAGNAWGANARELLGLASLKAGDYDAAGKAFDEIVTDRNAPPSLKQRADLLLGIVRSGPIKPAS
ncbi:hypothetical protein GCM10007036_19930 [Alsobacter metallidurans]|uniref:Ancillary SecYEG translocon subunit/Cell division coordinator CpoB TPR domain-containing protein n=1 Tax=Alsobacter metallidurans TaxID=340221 RepID=A0A917I6Z9_9HYPH|nr:tetratricopeptide repeat protein [Alsobacter metallidurans]GGH18028.1 hypothetical protein GCM10007036_19930 [Alsobacter metallidurans]